MSWPQILSGIVLVAMMLAVGGTFVASQWRLLRVLAGDASMPLDELIHQRRQARRRLVAGGLILLLAFLLVGGLILLENPAQELANERDRFPDPETRPELTTEQRDFARIYGWFWLVFLVLLLGLVILGAWDYLALRRFGSQQRRRIHDARRAMIASEARRLREERSEQYDPE